MSAPEYTIEQLEQIRKESLDVLSKDPKNLEASGDLVCADTMLCEKYYHSHGNQWRNYALCKEITEYIIPVIHCDDPDIYEMGIHVCERAADVLNDHPRLKWRLLKYALDTRISKSMEPDFDLENEVNYLVKNILHSDNGDPEKIVTEGMLKHDPVEWSKEYEEVIHLAQEKAYAELADRPFGMGFCHAYWHTLGRILKDDYGIVWRSPAQMNPRVMFD